MGETAELDSLGEDGILADTGVELGADSALELDRKSTRLNSSHR